MQKLKVVLPWSGLALALIFYSFKLCTTDIPVDKGDGILHFAIAQHSWEEPAEFVNHWGKPLFTLFASPFAQLGFKGYLCFNLLIFLLTCLTAFAVFSRLKISAAYKFLFPLLLVVIPDYTYCVLGGMTEVLFGFLLVLLLYLGVSGKWIGFALVASLTIFSRSEGMLVIVAALGLLMAEKQWKAIPLLASGFVIYAIAGYSHYHSFWWFFAEDPYTGIMFYGKGNWFHYLVSWRNYYGILLLLLTPAALFGWYLQSRKKDFSSTRITLFILVIYSGIIIIHSYLWATGSRGSAGLTRIATLGLPAFLAVLLYGCSAVTKELHFLPKSFALLFFLIVIVLKISDFPYPFPLNPLEKSVLQSADYIRKEHPDAKVYYSHPLFGWRMGVKILGDPGVVRYSFGNNAGEISKLENGSLIVRDPAFGPGEAGLSDELIRNVKDLHEIKRIKAGKSTDILIFEVRH